MKYLVSNDKPVIRNGKKLNELVVACCDTHGIYEVFTNKKDALHFARLVCFKDDAVLINVYYIKYDGKMWYGNGDICYFQKGKKLTPKEYYEREGIICF